LGQRNALIWAALHFLSLIDDIAVLAAPDSQDPWDKHDQYCDFTETAMNVDVSPAIVEPCNQPDVPGAKAWVLSLDCTWMPCSVYNGGRFLTLNGARIESGMSGSPILNGHGAPIGTISTSANTDSFNLHPSLSDCLPLWLWRIMTARADASLPA
jgi:hypothetical protein